jgi:hypothetical protein
MREQRESYELKLAEQIVSHPKKLHKYIRSKKKCRPSVGPILVNGVLTDSPPLMAKALSDGFVSVFDDTPPPNLLPHQLDGSISSLTFLEADVLAFLQRIKVESGPGPDSVGGHVLKNCAASLAGPLSIIFDRSLESATLPLIWKSALVTPIYKGKGPRSSPSSYRPVCLTCKTMERIIAGQLNVFLDENNVLSEHQFGFRPGYSPVEQLVLTYNDVSLWYDSGKCVNLVLFDFSKAFDRVNHDLLILKLHSIGVHGRLLGWLSDFLIGRDMAVCIAGCCGASRAVSSGVPQGSVLGPLLFLVFINHLICDLGCYYKIFADDLKIYLASSSPANPDLQACINILDTRARDWGLQFNISKCANLRFQRGLFPNEDSLFHIGGTPLEFASVHGDLGVTVDCHLKFHRHIELIAAKVGGIASNILRSTVCRSPEFMLIILISHLRPIMEYASPVWNTGYLGDLSVLESVQRRWTKQIQGLARFTYEDRLRYLKLFSVKGRLWRADLILCWRIFHEKSKISPSALFAPCQDRRTRGHIFKIFPLHVQTEARRRSFASRVVQHWNSLPSCVAEAKSLESFKSLLAVACGDSLYSFV